MAKYIQLFRLLNLPISTNGMTRQAFTLVEVIVTVGVFAVLMATVSVMMLGILRGGLKSATTGKARNEGSYAMSVMADQLKYARKMVNCFQNGSNSMTFLTDDETSRTFTLNLTTEAIEIDGNRITSDAVVVAQGSCTGGVFKCDMAHEAAQEVTLCFTVDSAQAIGTSGSSPVDFQTQVVLRNVRE